MEKIVVSCLESRIDENQSVYSRFLLGPFLSGHAVTVATALRRALLSEVKNIAITALHIQGVTHEFSTLVGIRESVLELSLHFQQIILSTQTKSKSVKIGYLHVQGPAIVHANDLKLPDGIECVNPTQYIATLSTEGLLVVKFLIGEKKSFLKNNTSTLNSKKIKEAKLYSAELNKALLNPAEYDPPRLFRLLRNQSFPNGAIVRKMIEASDRAKRLQSEALHPELRSGYRSESAPSESAIGPIAKKRLEPELEQVESSSRMPRIYDSIRDQSANHISDDFNSEVCLRTIIPLDPIFTPVYQVNFGIERDDLSNQIRERVIMEVWTNGSIHPRQAINEAALSTMSIFSKLRKTFQLDSHSLALSTNSTVPLTSFARGSRLHKTKNMTKGEVVSADASESVEPLAALLSLALRSRAKGARTPLGSFILGISGQAPLLREHRGKLITSLRGVQRSRVPVTRDRFAPVAQVRTEFRLLPKGSKGRVTFGHLLLAERSSAGESRQSNQNIFRRNTVVALRSQNRRFCVAPSRVYGLQSEALQRPRFALAKLSRAELDRTSSVRQKLNSSASAGFCEAKVKHPISLCLQNFAISHIRGQTFLLEQSFGLKARFFKGHPRARFGKTAAELRSAIRRPSKGIQLRTGLSKMANFRLGMCSSSGQAELVGLRSKLDNSYRSLQSYALQAPGLPEHSSGKPKGEIIPTEPLPSSRGGLGKRVDAFDTRSVVPGAERSSARDRKLVEYTSENQPLSEGTVAERSSAAQEWHTFKRTFLPSFKVVLGPFESLRNDVSARSESIYSRCTQLNLEQNPAGLTKASLLFKLRFSLAGAHFCVAKVRTFASVPRLLCNPTELRLQSEALQAKRSFAQASGLPELCSGSQSQKFLLRESVSEAFKPSWIGSRCFATQSNNRAVNQVSISLGRLLLVLSKSEQKWEHRSRLLLSSRQPPKGSCRASLCKPFARPLRNLGSESANTPIFVLAKAMKAGALQRETRPYELNTLAAAQPKVLLSEAEHGLRSNLGNARISCFRSDLLSNKVSSNRSFRAESFGCSAKLSSRKQEKGAAELRSARTFKLSNLRSSGQVQLNPSWSNFLSLAELRSATIGSAAELRSASKSKVTARIAQPNETRQFVCSARLRKQLKPKPILFLIKYRTFCFTRNALRIFRYKQEDSLFLLPLAKQLFRVKMARVFTSCLPLISKKSIPSLSSSFVETQAFTIVDAENRVHVKQLLLSLAASFTLGLRSGAKRESTLSLRNPEGGNQNSGAAISQGDNFLSRSLLSEAEQGPGLPEPSSGKPEGPNFPNVCEANVSKVSEALAELRSADIPTEPLAATQRLVTPEGAARSATVLKGRAPQKKIASLIALRARTPFERSYGAVSRFAGSKVWLRTNLKKQFGFFQFACNGSRPVHLHGFFQGSTSKSLGVAERSSAARSATPPRGLQERWQLSLRQPSKGGSLFARPLRRIESGSSPKLGSTWIRRGVERLGVCVKTLPSNVFVAMQPNKTESLAKEKRPGSVGPAKRNGTVPFATPLIMTKAPPLCLSSGLVALFSSLGSTSLCRRNYGAASKSYANSSEARIGPSLLVPQAVAELRSLLQSKSAQSEALQAAEFQLPNYKLNFRSLLLRKSAQSFAEQAKGTQSLAKVREARGTEGGKRLSLIYSSNLDKMSFLSSDLANLSLSLKTYTFLKKKGKNNIASLLEDSPNTLFSLLNGDKKMFHEIERCLLFLGLPFKERSWRT